MINEKKIDIEQLKSWSSTTVQAKNKLNSHLIISYINIYIYIYIFQKTYKVVLHYFYNFNDIYEKSLRVQ